MKRFFLPLILIASLISGCNIFDWTSNNKDEAFYDGLELFNDGKFSEAKQKFADAIKSDPQRSDFRYYHAKAVVFEANLNYFAMAQNLVKIDTATVMNVKLPLYTKEPDLSLAQDAEFKNHIYQASFVCHADLTPIYQEKTHGDIQAQDIYFDYAILALALALLRLRDTNGDGTITTDDFYFSIYKSSEGNYTFDLLGVKNYLSTPENRQAFNRTLVKSVDYLADGIFSLLKIFRNDTKYFDQQDLQSLLNNIKNAADRYQMDDDKDNDGDGRVDEEILNGIDDDGDGLIDEDVGIVP
ncbi:MAG TPA: hypothetical protein VGD14_15570 [bacterium]